MFVFLGASADSLAAPSSKQSSGVGRIVGLVLGIVFALAAIGLTMYYTKLELTRIQTNTNTSNPTTSQHQQQQQQDEDGGGDADDDEERNL
mmetsp:Transcript_45817/g.111731  ORF Transcript_45817/g.111731 Transcript_45817/m.111731 type:complete len:91 (+) Transcript_45817:780-1052(+)